MIQEEVAQCCRRVNKVIGGPRFPGFNVENGIKLRFVLELMYSVH